MIENFIKRSYYFSPELLKEWEIFHLPSKDYSPSAAAAFLVYITLEPALREQLRKLAFQKDIKKARIEARKALRETMINAYMTGFVGIFSEEDRRILMERFLQTEKKH
jgi:hypothetical protein